MHELPDPEWYLDNVLVFSEPGASKSLPKGSAGLWQLWWSRQAAGADEPLRTASRQGFVLPTAQLHSVGISRAAARHAVAHRRWTVPQRGFVAPLRLDGDANRHTVQRRVHAVTATAAALAHPGLAVSGRSSAILRGLPTMTVPSLPELTVATDAGAERRLGRRPVRHVYGAGLSAGAVERWFGAPVTSVVRTLVDLARHDRRDAVVAADAALHEKLVSRTELDSELETAAGWPGVRQARAVLALADPLAESPLESLVRLALHDSGLPPPALQVPIGGYRVDLCWPERRLVLEVDGLGKYSDDAWRREKRREQAIRSLGYTVERVTWDDVFRRWPATVARLLPLLSASRR